MAKYRCTLELCNRKDELCFAAFRKNDKTELKLLSDNKI